MITEIVREFTSACHPNLPDKPTLLSHDDVLLIQKLIHEELVTELNVATTIEDQADCLVDALYFIADRAVRNGINLDPLFNLVHQDNLKKIGKDGKVVRREDGKILKPEGWKAPELGPEIERQKQVGSFTKTSVVEFKAPVVDAAKIQEIMNEGALKAIRDQADDYFGWSGPFRKQIKETLDSQNPSVDLKLPDMVAVLNQRVVDQLNYSCDRAIAHTFIPMFCETFTGMKKEIKFTEILEEFVRQSDNDISPEDFSIEELEIRSRTSSVLGQTKAYRLTDGTGKPNGEFEFKIREETDYKDGEWIPNGKYKFVEPYADSRDKTIKIKTEDPESKRTFEIGIPVTHQYGNAMNRFMISAIFSGATIEIDEDGYFSDTVLQTRFEYYSSN
jgi:predicted HAD superfamily Cof-like phosphohydrolase